MNCWVATIGLVLPKPVARRGERRAWRGVVERAARQPARGAVPWPTYTQPRPPRQGRPAARKPPAAGQPGGAGAYRVVRGSVVEKDRPASRPTVSPRAAA